MHSSEVTSPSLLIHLRSQVESEESLTSPDEVGIDCLVVDYSAHNYMQMPDSVG